MTFKKMETLFQLVDSSNKTDCGNIKLILENYEK